MIKYITILVLFSVFLLSGCGSSSPIDNTSTQTDQGIKSGYIFVPAQKTGKILSSGSTSKTPGMIMMFSNTKPDGYEPLSGATITIDNSAIITDGKGYFSFNNLTSGIKRIKAEHPLWVSIRQNTVVTDATAGERPFNKFAIVKAESAAPVIITISPWTNFAIFNLESYGTLDSDIVKPGDKWSVDGTASIDSNGIFKAADEGTYTITSTASSETSPSDTITVKVINYSGIVYGYIKNNEGKPVQGAVASVNGNNLFAITDENGYYELPGEPSTDIIVTGEGSSGSTASTSTLTLNSDVMLQSPDIILNEQSSSMTAPSEGTWKLKQNTSQPLNAVFFTDPTRGWIAGNKGALLITISSGSYWGTQNTKTTENLTSLYFTSVNNGWVTGTNGTILNTSDGGSNWNSQNSNVTEDLNSVNFFDIKNGWVAGNKGTVLRTIDGGTNWTAQTSKTTADLKGISFVNLLNGWAVGTGGTIIHTIDGGKNWTAQNSNTSETLTSVYFLNLSRGMAAGANGTLLLTTDGGSTWSKQNSQTVNNLRSVYSANSLISLGGGENGTIIYSSDGGTNWTVETSGTGRIIKGFYLTSSGTAWAAGEEGSGGAIMVYGQ